jgi:hypothetical protein
VKSSRGTQKFGKPSFSPPSLTGFVELGRLTFFFRYKELIAVNLDCATSPIVSRDFRNFSQQTSLLFARLKVNDLTKNCKKKSMSDDVFDFRAITDKRPSPGDFSAAVARAS